MHTKPYRIIAVDPGYGRIGIAVLEKTGGKEVLLFSECFETNPGEEPSERLADLQKRFRGLLETHVPGALAIESLFFSKNQKTALAVAEARGVIMSEAAAHNLPVFEYKPVEVKVAVTGYGASDKLHIKEMVKRLLGFKKEKALDDEYDAIAVGLTHLASHRNR